MIDGVYHNPAVEAAVMDVLAEVASEHFDQNHEAASFLLRRAVAVGGGGGTGRRTVAEILVETLHMAVGAEWRIDGSLTVDVAALVAVMGMQALPPPDVPEDQMAGAVALAMRRVRGFRPMWELAEDMENAGALADVLYPLVLAFSELVMVAKASGHGLDGVSAVRN